MPLNVHTILALASKQIWPHVLTAIHFQPRQVVLLHSTEVGESKSPAERLADFYVRSGILAAGMVFQREIPYDNFTGIQEKLNALSSEFGLDRGDSALNFTGGNKLMSTAAFDWAQGVASLRSTSSVPTNSLFSSLGTAISSWGCRLHWTRKSRGTAIR